ncbi:MAG: SRPBCC family protein [Anaerolineae bacterium]|nr:SRPBCC family protein [Anaerolineae bacterium]
MKINFAVEVLGEPDKVFPWIDNPEKAMLWQKGVKKGEIIKETPEKIGTTFMEEMEEGGNSLVMHGVITGYIRNKMITFQLESKIHKLDVCYSITGEDGKSVITVESNIHWKFPMNIMRIIFGRKIKEGILKQTESEFAELKRLCEEEKVK